MFKDLLRKEDLMAKIDLKDAYFTVPIARQEIPEVQVGERDIPFLNCLPFGLSCALSVFTKITKAATTVLREMGIRIIVYIDDMLIMAELEAHIAGMVYLLENLGFLINYLKSILQPRRTMEFFSFQVDSSSMELKIPGPKMKKHQERCRKILASEEVTALDVSRILGKMNAATKVVATGLLFY